MWKLIWSNWILVVSVFVAVVYRSVGVVEIDDRIIFLDIGQGDATLIQIDGKNVLIDGGPDDTVVFKLSEYLLPWDREIDLIVLTHPHADHIDGLIDVLERYEVGEIWVNAICCSSPVWEDFLENDAVTQVFQGHTLTMGSGLIEVLRPIAGGVSDSGSGGGDVVKGRGDICDGEAGWFESFDGNLNNDSVVVQFTYTYSKSGFTDKVEDCEPGTEKMFSVLFTGDAEKELEGLLMANDQLESVDVFQAGHHCSKTSNGVGFLRVVQPRLAVCSCGEDNRHGHPSREVLDRFDNLGISYLRTDLDGDVVIDLAAN